MRRHVPLLLMSAACATACTGGELELFVDLRTDLIPAREFERVRVIVEPGGLSEMLASEMPPDSWRDGSRVAELRGLAAGEHVVVLTLFDSDGVVLDRTARLDLRETTAITLLATRDCTDVSCDAETTCRSAACVDQRCSELAAEFCGAAQCTSDADCVATSPCSTGVCVAGACLYAADDASCAADQWCSPDTGCQPIAGTMPALPGEEVSIPDGWTVEVFHDFSADFSFVPLQYDDDMVGLFSNRPHHAFLIEEPFEPGIGLVATWEVWEVRADAAVEHGSYYRAVGDAEGPDALFDAEFCGDYMGAGPGICVGAGSQRTGDGIFRIELDWSMTRISDDNNVGEIAFDETGRFEDIGVPTLYWAGPEGLRRLGEPLFYRGSMNGAFTEILPTGAILTMNSDFDAGTRRLVRLDPNTYAETTFLTTSIDPSTIINRQNSGSYRVIGGDISELPGYAYVIIDRGTLVRFDVAGVMEVVAQTDPADTWVWVHGVVAPTRHALSDGQPTFYIYEYDPMTETNRVFRLIPD